jgi:hypothetical protein
MIQAGILVFREVGLIVKRERDSQKRNKNTTDRKTKLSKA